MSNNPVCARGRGASCASRGRGRRGRGPQGGRARGRARRGAARGGPGWPLSPRPLAASSLGRPCRVAAPRLVPRAAGAGREAGRGRGAGCGGRPEGAAGGGVGRRDREAAPELRAERPADRSGGAGRAPGPGRVGGPPSPGGRRSGVGGGPAPAAPGARVGPSGEPGSPWPRAEPSLPGSRARGGRRPEPRGLGQRSTPARPGARPPKMEASPGAPHGNGPTALLLRLRTPRARGVRRPPAPGIRPQPLALHSDPRGKPSGGRSLRRPSPRSLARSPGSTSRSW